MKKDSDVSRREMLATTLALASAAGTAGAAAGQHETGITATEGAAAGSKATYLWSANITSTVTQPPSPADIRDVTRRGRLSMRCGTQTGVDVGAGWQEPRPGVAPGFLAPAPSVGGRGCNGQRTL